MISRLKIIRHLFTAVLAVFIANNAFAKLPDALKTNQEVAVIAILSQSDFVPDRTGAAPVGFPDSLADRVLEKLSKSRRFTPVEREALRRVILEQRFGQRLNETYLDRTLDQAIRNLDTMESVGDRVTGTRMKIEAGMGGIGGAMSIDNAIIPTPVGSGLGEGDGKIGTTGALANFDDILKDFLDLGSAAGTDFLVFGHLEKVERTTSTNAVPYSESRVESRNKVDARARIRLIDTKNSVVLGAASFDVELSETVFSSQSGTLDDAAVFDALSDKIAAKVIDLVYPAKIASIDPITITRGLNDLVSAGDEYSVLREGETIKDADNVVLGYLSNTVGVIVVDNLEENFSIVSALSNNDIKVGDRVKRKEKKQQQQAELTPGSSDTTQQVASNQKPTLAIGKIWFSSKQDAGKESPQIFTNTLISSLANTKRFDVIDRQELDQLLTEQEATLMREGNTLPSSIGTLIGADYLVLGTVSVFSIEDREVKLPGSSRIFKKNIGHVEGNVRITDVASGVVLESRKIAVSDTLQNDLENSQLLTHLADKFAYASVEITLNAIYPFKIIAVSSDGTIYLNRGIDGGLSSGEILRVFRQGRAIVDPDGNRNMGNEEQNVGELLITEVEDTRSKATLLSGGPFQAGDVLKNSGNTDGISPGSAGTGAASSATLAVRLVSMDKDLAPNGMSEAKLRYLSNILKAEFARQSDYTIVERLDIDEVLDEKTMTSLINDNDVSDTLKDLSEAGQILVGGITSMRFEDITREIPYLDKVEVYHVAYIEGAFKIIDSRTGEVISVEVVSTKLEFGSDTETEQAQNTLLRVYGERIAAALMGKVEPMAEKPAANKVSIPAW